MKYSSLIIWTDEYVLSGGHLRDLVKYSYSKITFHTCDGIPIVSPVTVAHQTIKYEYPAIQRMLPRNVKMKYLRSREHFYDDQNEKMIISSRGQLTGWIPCVWQSDIKWKHDWKRDKINQDFFPATRFWKAHVNLE